MPNTLHGITATSPLDLIVDAGVLVRNWTPGSAAAAWDIVGATDGGIKVTITPEIHMPSIDGAYAPVQGMERITKWDVNIDGTLKTIKIAAAMDLLLGASIANYAGAPTQYYDITPGTMSAADYQSNITLLVSQSNVPLLPFGAALMIMNARTDGKFALSTKHADEGSLPIHYDATVLPADPQTAPYRILWPKVAGETS